MPPPGWVPPKGWAPDPAWPDPPPGWELWIDESADSPSSSLSLGSTELTPAPVRGDEDDSGPTDLKRRLAVLEAENQALRTQLEGRDSDEPVILDDERVLQDVGIYRYHHPLENAAMYRARLAELSAQIADLVKAQKAIEVSSMFTFEGSLAKGRRMTGDLRRLMLRAYNAEVDNCLRTLRAGNVQTAKHRIDASRAAIKKLGRMMAMAISDAYHTLRHQELEITADFLMKKQEEREAAREERERLREERKVQAELEEQRKRLEKERAHLTNTLNALRQEGEVDPDLARRLAEVDDAIAQNDYRAANVRAGYVYVISNQGSFGRSVVKIGLTRRLEPMERVNELGDASVPFKFDVHGLFFSEDAVALEAELHRAFADRRLNHVNLRREFFFATPGEVRRVLETKVGNLLEYDEKGEAMEYMQSQRYWPAEYAASRRS